MYLVNCKSFVWRTEAKPWGWHVCKPWTDVLHQNQFLLLSPQVFFIFGTLNWQCFSETLPSPHSCIDHVETMVLFYFLLLYRSAWGLWDHVTPRGVSGLGLYVLRFPQTPWISAHVYTLQIFKNPHLFIYSKKCAVRDIFWKLSMILWQSLTQSEACQSVIV